MNTTTTTLRKCTGSERFGIEPHEAPIDDFTPQPSRKDGYAAMCKPHWSAYVKGLAADRKARQASAEFASAPTAAQAVEASVAKAKRGTAKPKAAKPTPTKKRNATAQARPPVDPKVAEAEAIIAEVDGLSGDEYTERVGGDEVQAAFELIGETNGHGRERAADVGTEA